MKSIALSKGYEAIVDDCDYLVLSKMKWHVVVCPYNLVYAVRRQKINGKIINIMMHRFILGLIGNKKFQVDHINGNGLDNRRSNLRPCTDQQNKFNMKKRSDNTSGYKGVSWLPDRKRWQAQIQINKKNSRIGRFLSKVEAANAYDKRAVELFGEFAKLNFKGGASSD